VMRMTSRPLSQRPLRAALTRASPSRSRHKVVVVWRQELRQVVAVFARDYPDLARKIHHADAQTVINPPTSTPSGPDCSLVLLPSITAGASFVRHFHCLSPTSSARPTWRSSLQQTYRVRDLEGRQHVPVRARRAGAGPADDGGRDHVLSVSAAPRSTNLPRPGGVRSTTPSASAPIIGGIVRGLITAAPWRTSARRALAGTTASP
jgi:hypothetical protein